MQGILALKKTKSANAEKSGLIIKLNLYLILVIVVAFSVCRLIHKKKWGKVLTSALLTGLKMYWIFGFQIVAFEMYQRPKGLKKSFSNSQV